MKIPRAIDRWLRRLLENHGQPYDMAEGRREDIEWMAEIGTSIAHSASDSLRPYISPEGKAKIDAEVFELIQRLGNIGGPYVAYMRKPEGDL